ncbi:lysophospholipid acyltransferase family protein [Geoalkalibacter halelectricus]|uniref:1-acyl-sn-glycerol-3-phosphate acyltransferase n=1 Tax=Geoalkalibacter halelectricus TaxID=2847045 RepID=A0ABY5ZUC2_9BACT|nr:lysophospholipid acyltransferase family protein [Geoalkalibacter halelectricus]MDO3377428.1 1-acyl-sn-glycerol-3-phosphate acyltransferase [Geoalkalibacter halelectricus]UWZ80811.1 1-acyl-sn-glycerol-3-phosphate acyltransferase [Geoalkalibacter halelectricus]
MLRTLFFSATFIPWTLAVLLVSLPLSLFGPDALHRLARIWARGALLPAGVRVRCRGEVALESGQAVIFMPNHQSNFDILALLACIRPPFRWLAKKELFSIPLFGTAMRLAGCIAVDRGDRERAVASMDEAARRIRGGESVVIFPEGTRSFDDRLLPFKKGGFMTALKAQAPVIPVRISGSGQVHRKHSRRIRAGTIAIDFLPPIETRGLTTDDRDLLMDWVRRALSAHAEEHEAKTT